MRRLPLGLVGVLLAGCLVCGGHSTAGEKKKELGHEDQHAGHFADCAKACSACMQECESCTLHCAKLVADGKKDHLHTLGTCMDCGQICSSAAIIVSHRGPMSKLMCEACAKACDSCGTACERFKDDEHMARCAKECRNCARACRAMLENAPKVESGK
jgi:hypothetical protein